MSEMAPEAINPNEGQAAVEYAVNADPGMLERLWNQAVMDENWEEANRLQGLLYGN